MKLERPVWISGVPARKASDGALQGLSFAIKDNIDYAGVPTTAGCPAYAYTPSKSAFVVDALEKAGAVAIGKTNLDQFATGLVGVRSPYGACSSVFHTDYVSGGSSSGSAVAVATKQVDFALGTDTAGSGRVPAAFNNLIGLKPTRGLLSCSGVVPACRSLDCVSIFTRDVATARRVFSAAAVYDPADAFSRRFAPTGFPWSSGTFRFGYLREEQRQFFGDTEAARLYSQSLDQLQRIGGQPVAIDYAPFQEAAQLLYAGPWVAERRAILGAFLTQHEADIHPTVHRIISGADRFSAVDAFLASYKLMEARRRTEATWQEIDLLALPTTGTIYKIAAVEADPIQLNTNLGYYTNFVNLLDLAAIAVPAGFRPNGLPFGITLMAPAMSIDRATRLRRLVSRRRTFDRHAAQPRTHQPRRAPAADHPHRAALSALPSRRHKTTQARPAPHARLRWPRHHRRSLGHPHRSLRQLRCQRACAHGHRHVGTGRWQLGEGLPLRSLRVGNGAQHHTLRRLARLHKVSGLKYTRQ
jgi:allophanate hydrolase